MTPSFTRGLRLPRGSLEGHPPDVVEIPRVDAAIKAGRDEEALVRQVLYVLHPVAVRLQTVDLLAQVPHVPDGHRLVVRARGEHPAVEEPARRTGRGTESSGGGPHGIVIVRRRTGVCGAWCSLSTAHWF